MQTFLPYADFEGSARVLDPKRLGKQRVEVIQIIRALTWPKYGWAHHPAVLMWKGYEEALGRYGLTCCAVWTERGGIGDTCAATIATDLKPIGIHGIRTQVELAASDALPPWLGNPDIHLAHRSALMRKDPGWYGPRFPGVPEDLPYVWPVRSASVLEAERRKTENTRLRARRVAERAVKEAEQASRRRSRAAKRGWTTRRAGLKGPD